MVKFDDSTTIDEERGIEQKTTEITNLFRHAERVRDKRQSSAETRRRIKNGD